MEEPHKLRSLASWFRDMAQLGNEAESKWREGFADYLEKRATEIEAMRVGGSSRAQITNPVVLPADEISDI